MPKSRRTVLSSIVVPMPREPSAALAAVPEDTSRGAMTGATAPAERRRSSTKDRTIQQAVYLPPAVHEQLRELAFAERAKMHDFYVEGLDAVFRKRGLKSIAELTRKT